MHSMSLRVVQSRAALCQVRMASTRKAGLRAAFVLGQKSERKIASAERAIEKAEKTVRVLSEKALQLKGTFAKVAVAQRSAAAKKAAEGVVKRKAARIAKQSALQRVFAKARIARMRVVALKAAGPSSALEKAVQRVKAMQAMVQRVKARQAMAQKTRNTTKANTKVNKIKRASMFVSKHTRLQKVFGAKKAALADLRKKRAALVALKKEEKSLLSAGEKAKQRIERRKLLKSAGPTGPWAVFLKENMKGMKPDASLMPRMAAQYKSLSSEERARYVAVATKNRAARDGMVKQEKEKKPITPYQQHFRDHFPAAYKTAVANGSGDRKAAFATAAKEVSALWKSKM